MEVSLKKFKLVPKKRVRKVLVHGKIVITETLNNLFIAITKVSGDVILKASIGQVCKKLRLELRKTPLSAELLGKYIGERMLERGFIRYVLNISKAITKLVKSAVKGLTKKANKCKRINFLEKISHNGVRLRAARRK